MLYIEAGKMLGAGRGDLSTQAEGGGGGTGHLEYLLWVSRMLSPGLNPFPFFSKTSQDSGTPWATQMKMVLLPGGLDKDCGHWTNSEGARQVMARWEVP